MSYNAYYNYLKKKKIKDEEQKIDDSLSKNPYSLYYNYLKAKNEVKNDSSTDGSEDIAPVGGKKDTWFKGGGFSDGVDGVGDFFVDLGETVGGTVGDLGVGLLKGATRLVEGLNDLGVQAVGGAAGILGADDFKEYMKEVAAHNATDAIFEAPEEFFDKGSVLGDKSDNVSEGLGQVGAIIFTGGALGAAGVSSTAVSGITTGAMGLSSMGSGITEAYESGASDGEAWKYGLNKGAIDATSELIFGGLGKASQALGFSKGLSSLDDIAAKKVGNTLSKIAKKEGGKQLLNNFGEFVVKSGAEGAEEVIAGYLTAHAKKGTYMSEEDFSKILEDENLLEQFIVGSLTSAVSQSGVVPGMKRGSLIETTKNGEDFVTGHTKNEQTVVDKIFEKELSKEKNKALSKKQKNELYESIVEDMQRGQISVEEIEEILGGEDYTSYKKASDENASLKKELEELSNMKKGDNMTRNQEKRLAELEEMNLDDTTKIDELRSKVSKTVREMVNNDRKGGGSLLMESYLERSRMSEDLKIDVDKYKDTKYAEAAKKTIENALNAKANNTRAVHDLVDMMAKVSSETNEVFKFGSNDSVKADYLKLQNENLAKLEAVKNKSDAQIKEIVEIKQAIAKVQSGEVKVNGNISSDGIMINLDSPRALNKIVGHEVTHKLEKSEHYTKLQEALFAYAKTKGVKVNERLKELESIYKGVKGADAKAELTSDLVGEYLFSDYDFIKNLAKDRNTFQKVWDEIKHLAKLATAGSKESRELEKVKRMFEKAYQESKENVRVSATDSIQYNLSAVTDHKAKLNEEFSVDASVDLKTLTERYDKIIGIWEKLGGKLDSKFLKEWDAKKGKDRAFSVFKKQDGYKYNLELSTLCKKGVPLFEAIDQIVKKEVMSQLNTDTIGKAEKEILYDILKEHNFEIPCAICYVEQARQREGVIINNFLNGNTDGKLGWNQVLTDVQELMKKSGVEYKFPNVDRSIATDAYSPSDINMTEQEQDAFFSAIMELANKEISKLNADPKVKTKRILIKEATPQAISEALKGRINQNLGIFKVLAQNPDQRFMIDRDLLLSSETSSNLTRTHNALYGLFNQQGGVSGYKTKQSAVVYWGDLLSTKWDTTKLRNEGGMRNQSNSDFQMYTLLDQAQMYMDLTAKGYTLHAYTKVLSELKLFGLSRGKINASLIPKVKVYYNADGTVNIERTMATAGLDENGDLFFDDIEGINHDEAFMLIEDEEYSKNIGGICIGYSDAHIQKLLDDKRVQLIIGFHDKTNDIDKRYRGARYAKNYRGINEAQSVDGKAVHIKFGSFLKKAENLFGYNTKTETFGKESATFNGKTYSVNDIPKLAADMYLKHCATKGLSPAYSAGGINFSKHENYYKLLADFSLYDSQGNYAPQRKVSYEMPDQVPYLDGNGVKQYMDTEKFIENELYKEMALRDSISNALADTSGDGIIPQFVKRVNDLHSEKKQYSLSGVNSKTAGRNDVFGKDFRVQDAPIREDINETVDNVAENVDNNNGDKKSQIESRINELKAQGEAFVNEVNKLNEQMAKGEIVADDYQAKLKEIKSKWDEVRNEQNTLTEELTKLENTVVEIEKKPLRQLVNTLAKKLDLKKAEKLSLEKLIQDYNKGVYKNKEELLEAVKKGFDTHYYTERNEVIAEVRDYVCNTAISVSEDVKSDAGYQAGGWGKFYRRNMGRIRLSQNGVDVDTFYQEASELYPGFFPDDITNPADQLRKIEEVANMPKDEIRAEPLGDELMQDITDYIYDSVAEYKSSETFKILNEQFYDIDSKLEQDKKALDEEYAKKKADAEAINDKGAFIKQKAKQFVDEFNTHKQGTRFSDEIGYLKDLGYGWGEIKSAFNNIRHSPNKMVNSNPDNHYYEVEMAAREVLNEAYEDAVYESTNLDAKYNEKLAELEAEANKAREDAKKGVTGTQRQKKQKIYDEECRSLMGDTTNWKDRKYGISYLINTLQRNLREVVRDANGNRDIAKADAIYEYLQGDYNHNEAELKKESRTLKKPLADLKVNKYESEYAQMLGEFRHNPETELTQEVVDAYYNKHKDKINTVKVDEAIEYVRNTYDTLIERVNEVLREQGMKEIPYRKGYFPHFTNEKQGWLGKLLNWKTQNTEIPTDIAGMTEQFNPNRSWQSFNKQRKGDTTDYNLLKGFDQYVHGALDWIYHIEDLQKRRAFENEIRYAHSEKGIQEKIEKIKANTELDADEAQEQMDAVWKEAKNPLNNFVTDLRNGTNALAGKKSTADRELEYTTNRKIYSTMTNISNRVTANMVAGSVSSALTNFIPITQSWGMVSPVSSLKATRDLIKNVIKDDGMIEKSDFMTNRLLQEENLAKTGWDKVGEVVGGMMTIADRISTEVVWRSKYIENINNGMSENEAVHDADSFAEKVMAGRSRGNMPTIYNSKRPLIKMFTAFQLEVANQYGYMFKDMPQDIGKENKGKLVKGYATMFIGAYIYNALYSALVGRDAAFDPIGIIEDLLKDLFPKDDEEEADVVGAVEGLAENVTQELPFVGGLLGGGRMPISSALPDWEELWEAMTDEDKEVRKKKFISSLDGTFYYGVLPMGGGQLKKTTQGLKMFSEDIGPVSGSYTDSGNLRFPVEDTFGNRVQAAVFGQYASKNAREYFDNDFAPLTPKQTEEYAQVGMDYTEYQKYRKGLSRLKTNEEKFNYINSLDLTTEQKNVLVNNVVDRKTPVDMSDYGDYVSYEEFDYATKYPEKYLIAEVVGGYEAYKSYAEALNEIEPNYYPSGQAINGSKKQKVIRYINSLNAEQGAKMILLKMMYPSETRYDMGIRIYLKNQGLSNVEINAILTELGI